MSNDFPLTLTPEAGDSFKGTDLYRAISRQWGDDAVGAGATRKSARFQYWKQCDRERCQRHTSKATGLREQKGWICIGPDMGDALGHARLINIKHMTPLPQYGTMTPDDGPEGCLGPEAYVKFRKILLSPGGLFEFPADQIIAYGWDENPEVQQIRPDVTAVKRLECPYHPGRKFLTQQDIMDHNSVMHKDIVGPQAIGREIRDSLAANSAVDTATLSAAVVAAITQMMPQLMQMAQAGARPLAHTQELPPPTPPGVNPHDHTSAMPEFQPESAPVPVKRGPGRPPKTPRFTPD